MFNAKSITVALAGAFVLAANASAGTIDQSQLSYNTGVPFLFQGTTVNNLPLGQSFTAGQNGLLSAIYLGSNGGIQGGSNTLTFDIRDGSGISGSLLGHGTAAVSSVWTPSVGQWLLTINTANLGVNVQSGHQYTFDFTAISGSGDLAYRGILGKTTNPYAGGRIFTGQGYGNQPNWDLVFRTEVTAVPEPETYAMMIAGLGILAFSARRKNAQKLG